MSVNETNPSELDLLKQRIIELEAKSAKLESEKIVLEAMSTKLEAENAELRKENTEIHNLRIKLSVSDAEIAELKRRNIEFLNSNKEYNERRDAEIAKLKTENNDFRDRLSKVEQNHSLIDYNSDSSNNTSSNFNLVAKEKICSKQDSKCKKGVDKLKQELFTSELPTQESSVEQNHVIEISETLCSGKITSKSNIDEASQHLAQLCDKAFDAGDKANRANQEEILCWCLYAKDFIIQLNEIIDSSEKFGEKKARGLLYDSITKQLNLIRKQKSQETGLQLQDVSRDSLRKKTQRAEKVYKLIEQVGLDKIKYIKSYSATSISGFTNEQIQEVINYGISLEKNPEVL